MQTRPSWVARIRTRAITSLAALLILAGCSAHVALPSGAIAIPTDDKVVSSAQSGILCTLSAAIPSVVGTLAGDASDSAWPVWLLAPDGTPIYVLWPRGFSARFDPGVTLLDETGAPILHAGSPVTLQVSVDPAKGTKDHPYVAAGLWQTGLAQAAHCYTHVG